MSVSRDILIVAVGCDAGQAVSPLTGGAGTYRVLALGTPGRSDESRPERRGLPAGAFRLHGADLLSRRELALVVAEVASRVGAHMVVLAGAQDAVELLGHTAKALQMPILGQVAEVRGAVLRTVEREGVQLGYPISSGSGVAHFAVPEHAVTPLAAMEGAVGRPPARSLKIRRGRGNVAWVTDGGAELGTGPIVLGGAPGSVTSRSCEAVPRGAGTAKLSEAGVVIAAGAGVGEAGVSAMLAEASQRLGVSFGATRVVTDAGWAPESVQIGTTGVTIHPRLYVAIGVSGATQHTGGVESPGQVIAVNTDPGAQIFSIADRAIIADAPEVVRALWELAFEETGQGGADDDT